VKGLIDSEFKLQFYSSPKPGAVVVTELSYSMFRFIIDETKNTPTVEFVFDESWLNQAIYPGHNKSYYSDLGFIDVLLSGKVVMAKVRISSETMEREVYLQKVH